MKLKHIDDFQDESASAAMLSVELDDQLGGTPTQHRSKFCTLLILYIYVFNPLCSREVQEGESTLFLSYFPKESQGCRKFCYFVLFLPEIQSGL
jgi:hypothetical protein